MGDAGGGKEIQKEGNRRAGGDGGGTGAGEIDHTTIQGGEGRPAFSSTASEG